MNSVVFALLLLSPASDLERTAADAFKAGDYRAAATSWGQLARLHTDFDAREVAVYTAARTWARVDVCEGLALLRWWFTEGQPVDPEFIAQYRQLRLKKQESGLRCTVGSATAPSHAREPLAAVEVEQSAVVPPRPRIYLPVASPSPAGGDSRRDSRPLKIAGGVLTASAGVSLGVFTGLAVVYAQRLEAYRLVDGPDEDLYRQGLKIQRWTIATGAIACAAFVTGVTLLVSARRRATIQPSIGGLILQGEF